MECNSKSRKLKIKKKFNKMNKLIKCINEFEVDNGIFFIDVIFGFVFYCEKRLKKELVNYW